MIREFDGDFEKVERQNMPSFGFPLLAVLHAE